MPASRHSIVAGALLFAVFMMFSAPPLAGADSFVASDGLGDLEDLDFGDEGDLDGGLDFGDEGDLDGGFDFGDEEPFGDGPGMDDDLFGEGGGLPPGGGGVTGEDPWEEADPWETEPLAEDPFTTLLGTEDGVELAGVDLDELSEEITGFADLLDELRRRGLERPFHRLALTRLRARTARRVQGSFEGQDLLARVDALVAAARDPALGVPAAELRRIQALRGGGHGAPSGEIGEDDLCQGDDLDCVDLPEGDWGPLPSAEELDLGLDEGFGEGSIFEVDVAPGGEVASPFRIFDLRRRVARAVLAPPSADEWVTWLQGDAGELAVVEEGLEEVVGTRLGRETLEAVVRRGVPEAGARVLARVLGDLGGADDRGLLELLARTSPGIEEEVARAEGRIGERLTRQDGLSRSQRRRMAELLLEQAGDLAARRDWPAATRVAREAAEIVPRSSLANHRLALYAYQQGQYQRAREALEAALGAGGDHHLLVTLYAKVLRRQGASEELRHFLEGVLQQGGPTELKVRVCNELALEYSLLGRGREAIRLARIGLDYFVPEVVRDNLLTRLAEGLVLEGRLEEAERVYQQALRLDPSYRKARLGLDALRARRASARPSGGSWLRP